MIIPLRKWTYVEWSGVFRLISSGFLWVFGSAWHSPLFLLKWQALLAQIQKNTPKHHRYSLHTWQWGWYLLDGKLCQFSPIYNIMNFGQIILWFSLNSVSSVTYVVHFNKFPDFFVQAFKIVVDSWNFSMLLLYILWHDWPIFMISGSNEQLQKELVYILIVTAGKFQKCNLDMRTL